VLSKVLKLYRKLLLYLFILMILLIVASCVQPENAGKIELLAPQNNSIDVEFNNVILIFKSPSKDRYEVVIEENDTKVEATRVTVEVDEGVSKSVLIPKGYLKPSKKYRWYVKSGSSSKESSMWYFTTKSNSSPTLSNLKPKNAQNVRFDSLTLSWSASDPDGDDLMFIIRILEEEKVVFEGTSTTNFITVRDLKQLTDYIWQVKAIDPWNGESEVQSASFKTIANNPPYKIELLNPKPNSTDADFSNLQLIWKGYDDDTPELYYTIELSDSGNSQIILSNSTQTSITVNSLKRNTKYDLKITATDKYGASISNTFSFTTRLSTPPNAPSLVNPTNGEKINLAVV